MESKNRSYLSELCIFNLVKCCWGMPVLRCKRACFATKRWHITAQKVAYFVVKRHVLPPERESVQLKYRDRFPLKAS